MSYFYTYPGLTLYSEVNEVLSKGATLAIKERSVTTTGNTLEVYSTKADLLGSVRSLSAVIKLEKKQE